MDDQSHGRREGSWSMAAVSEFKRRKERRAQDVNVVYLIGKRISFPNDSSLFPLTLETKEIRISRTRNYHLTGDEIFGREKKIGNFDGNKTRVHRSLFTVRVRNEGNAKRTATARDTSSQPGGGET